MRRNIHQKNTSLLLEKIEQADAVCIGAAAGMSAACGHHYHYSSDPIFKQYFSEFEKKYGFQGTFNGFYYPFPTSEERWALIATTLYLQFHYQFPDERVATIQGDNRFFQCKKPCHDEVYESREIAERLYANIKDCRIPIDMIPRCPKCGRELEPWVRGYTFLEGELYKEQYRKWEDFLHENAEKKVLFLELGVGQMTPMFIRHPFWNLTYQMPQAYYIAVNPKDAQMPKELAGKGSIISEDIAAVLHDALALKGGQADRQCG